MHIYPENSKGLGPKNGEHISDWFVKLLDKYPDILSRVLENYIDCVITNPIREVSYINCCIKVKYRFYNLIFFSGKPEMRKLPLDMRPNMMQLSMPNVTNPARICYLRLSKRMKQWVFSYDLSNLLSAFCSIRHRWSGESFDTMCPLNQEKFL